MVARIYDYTNDVPSFIARSEEGFPAGPKDGSTVKFIDSGKIYTFYNGSWYDADGDRIECDILSATLTIGEDKYPGRINGTAVTITVPAGTVVTELNPVIVASPGATVAPTTAQDFTTPVTYTVTAENTTNTQEYTIAVEVEVEN